MSGTETLTEIGMETISTSSPDIEAIFQSAAAAIATIPASNKFTYNGNNLPQGDGNSVLFIPASVTGNVTMPAGYGYVVVAQGSQVNLYSPEQLNQVVVGDGFNAYLRASVIANGGGASTVYDGYVTPNNPASGTTETIHVAGTGLIAGGLNSSIVVDAGANVTVTAVPTPEFRTQAITVAGGATARINQPGVGGPLTLLAGAKANVTLAELGSTDVFIGFNPGATPTVPLTPPTVPNAANEAERIQQAPVFTNQIAVAGGSGVGYTGGGGYPRANTFTINDASSVNLIALGVADTVTISAGTSTIFGQAANLISAAGPTGVFFVGGADTLTAASIDPRHAATSSNASTILGGAGNSTLFATAGDVFNLGSNFGAAQANVFVGGTAASTINANAGGGDFFGGSHGDQYNAGTSLSQIFVGDGGADTINAVGAGLVAPVIYAQGAEQLLLVSSAASTVVGFTHGGVINAAGTTADNAVFAGYGIGGNQTLIGSTSSFDGSGNATHDTFVVGANSAGTASALTIDNWHAGDVFFLTGFTPADTATMDTAIANGLANGASGDLTFTLSDNSTITFIGSHPTNYSGTAAF